MKMSLSRKIGIVVGSVACMAVVTTGIAFGCEKFLFLGMRRTEKRYEAMRLKQAGETKAEAESKL